jgi:acyl carrier protein
MGLCYVEMIMACEEEFGTQINLTESNRLQTVGDLYHYLLKKLEQREEGRCAYAGAFFRLRRAMMLHADCPKPNIRPHAQVRALLPWRDRHRAWRQIERESGLSLPELSEWVPEGLIFTACIVIGLPVGFFGALALGIGASAILPEAKELLPVVGGVVGAVAAFGVPVLMAIVLQNLSHSRIPSAWTVDSLVRYAFKERYGIRGADGTQWDCAMVWNTLTRVVAERLAVPPELVTPDARFVEDLGAD